MIDLEAVRAAFADPGSFGESPLYRALCGLAVGNDRVLELAGRGRPGQVPTYLLFGAVHQLLLAGADHPLAAFYPSVVGAKARPADDVGPEFADFCARFEAELTAIIRTRLVQTNQVQRSLGLRLGLAAIAAEVVGPAHLIEVGTSAGLNLGYNRYGFSVGGRHYGDPKSVVQLTADLFGPRALPDLDVLPTIVSTLGIDLNPIEVTNPSDRRWLEALVWPENHDQRLLLDEALTLMATKPPTILAGDAIDLLPLLRLPDSEPRIVFHSATRMHVPADRRDAFDAAILALGETGPLWWLQIESGLQVDNRPDKSRDAAALSVRGPDGALRDIAAVNGHLRWIEMVS